MNDIVMARTSLFRQPASQPASPPAFANLITSFFLRKTWLKIKEAEAHLRNKLKITDSDKIWKKLTETSNCYMAGAVSGIKEDEHTQLILTKLDAADVSKVNKT
ncbi:hypothetical protein DPMN_035676 [Dreissena polymorpha]|uniref:Uncharacterized protein n=1 Tax=Dreissena polymorpha TaxID=45954 RepID=A0A9D4RN73_DREPO|nr:hypothetical protein DPMN_035676 [Dreissena polymorpha]